LQIRNAFKCDAPISPITCQQMVGGFTELGQLSMTKSTIKCSNRFLTRSRPVYTTLLQNQSKLQTLRWF